MLAHPGGTGIPQELAVVYWSAIALFCQGVPSLLPVHGDWPQQRREGVGFWLLFFCIIIPSSAVVQVFWDKDTKTEPGVKDTERNAWEEEGEGAGKDEGAFRPWYRLDTGEGDGELRNGARGISDCSVVLGKIGPDPFRRCLPKGACRRSPASHRNRPAPASALGPVSGAAHGALSWSGGCRGGEPSDVFSQLVLHGLRSRWGICVTATPSPLPSSIFSTASPSSASKDYKTFRK